MHAIDDKPAAGATMSWASACSLSMPLMPVRRRLKAFKDAEPMEAILGLVAAAANGFVAAARAAGDGISSLARRAATGAGAGARRKGVPLASAVAAQAAVDGILTASRPSFGMLIPCKQLLLHAGFQSMMQVVRSQVQQDSMPHHTSVPTARLLLQRRQWAKQRE